MPLQTAHRREEERRAQLRSLVTGTPPIKLSSAEDTILAKLKRYQAMSGSKRQWADTLRVRTELEQALTDAQAEKL